MAPADCGAGVGGQQHEGCGAGAAGPDRAHRGGDTGAIPGSGTNLRYMVKQKKAKSVVQDIASLTQTNCRDREEFPH